MKRHITSLVLLTVVCPAVRAADWPGWRGPPVLYGHLAILWCGPNDGKGRNFLLAVNKKTGETVWEHDEKAGSWGTPLITKVDGNDQLLLAMGPHLKGFDPKTGKELWFCNG